jgi:hypothetical protein
MFNSRWFSIAVGGGLAILLLVGLLTVVPAFAQGGMMGGRGGMMGGGYGPGWMMQNTQGFSDTVPFGPGGMMGGYGPGWMMQNSQGFSGTVPFGPGGMMDGAGGMMGGGMMVNPNNPFYTAPEPLTLEEATTILDAYLADLDDANLAYQDVMIFDNHAYAQIVEKDSDTGVMEVLIDPTSKAVYPEMGPNMMWNQKYGMTLAPARSAGVSGYGRYGMMGGMMGGSYNGPRGNPNFGNADNLAELTVTPSQAVEAAQEYLAANFSDKALTADEHADPFYGYYTLHLNQDGQTVGMLSVNGTTGAVWPHTWHGQLLAMSPE